MRKPTTRTRGAEARGNTVSAPELHRSGSRLLLGPMLGVALGLLATPASAGASFTPYVVNGLVTAAYPTVGLLANSDERVVCSGALVGCRTFVTAAHCVCPFDASTAVDCLRGGVAKPSSLLIFLQHAGYQAVSEVAVDPDYRFGEGGDVAVLTLSGPINGIAPTPLNTSGHPAAGSEGIITGFGSTGGSQVADAGIKRSGAVMISPCVDVPEASNVCWPFTPPLGPPGDDSNTCEGDSGGPLFINTGTGNVLAGLTSGGRPQSCLAEPNGMSFDTDVFSVREFIQRHAGSDLDNTSCGSSPQVGNPGTTVFEAEDTLSASKTEARYTITVPPATTDLRVELNGEFGSDISPTDFDLYVKQGSDPSTTDNDCADESRLTLGDCQLTDPIPGAWHVLVTRVNGKGLFQLTATTFGAPVPPCAGDCDGTGQVTVDEIITITNIALGESSVSICQIGDTNGDGQITVDEILAAVNNALDGCPMA